MYMFKYIYKCLLRFLSLKQCSTSPITPKIETYPNEEKSVPIRSANPKQLSKKAIPLIINVAPAA